MIPRAHITAWRSRAPWSSDGQIEQDLVVCRALVEIYSDGLAAKEVAFRGGTALHKLFFDSPGRYSEDLDLVQVNAGPIGPVMNAIRARLDPWLGKPQWKQSAGRVTIYYQFESEMKPVTPMRLKVEINTREHFTVLGFERVAFSVENPWFSGGADVLTYPPEELLGTKLRALYQRRKGRDLFDLAEALQRLPGLDLPKVIDCFNRYLDNDGTHISRAEFEGNLARKLKDALFTSDVPPLLALGISFNAIEAHQRVGEALLSRLAGEPWKQPDKSSKRG